MVPNTRLILVLSKREGSMIKLVQVRFEPRPQRYITKNPTSFDALVPTNHAQLLSMTSQSSLKNGPVI